MREYDTLIITVFAAGLDGRETPAYAFVIEREDDGTRKRLAWLADSATGHRNHNRALVQALLEATLRCPRNSRIQVETTSEGFLVRSLIEHRPRWKAREKWPKTTGADWKRFEAMLSASGITLEDARHIKSGAALTFAQEQTEQVRAKMRGERDRLVQFSEY
jgi:ribonuclease HI